MAFESMTLEQAACLPGVSNYLAGKTVTEGDGLSLGRAGVFHRVFRDQMR